MEIEPFNTFKNAICDRTLHRPFERRIPSRPAAIGLRKQAGYMTAHLTRYYVQPRALAFSGASIHDNTIPIHTGMKKVPIKPV
jgi:hypothetical protein